MSAESERAERIESLLSVLLACQSLGWTVLRVNGVPLPQPKESK